MTENRPMFSRAIGWKEEVGEDVKAGRYDESKRWKETVRGEGRRHCLDSGDDITDVHIC